MDTPNKVLADRIRERMEALGLNPYSAANKAELGESFVRDILKGKVKNPSAKRLAKLALALECSLNYLLGEEEMERLPDPDHRPNYWIIDKPSLHGRTVEARAPEATSSSSPVLLPIRYELMADAYRKASEVARSHPRLEPATIPPRYEGRACWWELVLDDTVERVAPKGSIVLVVELTDYEKNNLQDGDFVIIARRFASEEAHFNLVDRSMRRITLRYPDLGLWFFEFATADPEMDATDDIYKQRPRLDKRTAAALPTDPEEAARARQAAVAKWEQAAREAGRTEEDIARTREAMREMDDLMANPELAEAVLKIREATTAKIQGKVIRVLTPLDNEAEFISRTTKP